MSHTPNVNPVGGLAIDEEIEMLNTSLKAEKPEQHLFYKGLLFHHGSLNIHLVDVPCFPDVIDWKTIDDLDTRPWCDSRGAFYHIWNLEFTRQFCSQCLCCNLDFQHGFTVYTMPQRGNGFGNRPLRELTESAINWVGNVLVMKNSGLFEEDLQNAVMEDIPIVKHLLESLLVNEALNLSYDLVSEDSDDDQ